MKIGIDIREAGGVKAGKGWYAFHLVQNLLELDRKNEYILYSKNLIPGFDKKNAVLKTFKEKSPLWHLKVLRDLKKEKVELFFAPTSFIIPALLPKNIKSVITVHDLVAFLYPQNHDKKAVLLEKLFLKKAAKKADKILAVSKNTKKDLIEILSVPKEKIEVVYCAAGSEFKPVPKEKLTKFSVETNLPKKFFLGVGSLVPRKNYPNLIRAFIKINKDFPDHHLIIVGDEGWNKKENKEIKNLIRDNYLSKKVHLIGYLSNSSLVNLYNLARGLVFVSLYEGFGIPPLEAFACGTPVIASNVSSIPEVVGDAAILVDPKNIEEISLAMGRLIVDEDLCIQLKEKGFIQAQKFSWKMSAEKLLETITLHFF